MEPPLMVTLPNSHLPTATTSRQLQVYEFLELLPYINLSNAATSQQQSVCEFLDV